jgi:hypothetical protein
VRQPDERTRICQQVASPLERGHVTSDVTGLPIADQVVEDGLHRQIGPGVSGDGAGDIGATETRLDSHVQIDAETVLDALDDGAAALDPVGLETVEFGHEGVGGIHPVAQQVQALVASLDSQFDPMDDRQPLAVDHRLVERGVEPVVVGDGDGIQSCVAGSVTDPRKRERPVGGRRVDVEICDDHANPWLALAFGVAVDATCRRVTPLIHV